MREAAGLKSEREHRASPNSADRMLHGTLHSVMPGEPMSLDLIAYSAALAGVRGRCYRARTQHQAGTFHSVQGKRNQSTLAAVRASGGGGGTTTRRFFSATALGNRRSGGGFRFGIGFLLTAASHHAATGNEAESAEQEHGAWFGNGRGWSAVEGQ